MKMLIEQEQYVKQFHFIILKQQNINSLALISGSDDWRGP